MPKVNLSDALVRSLPSPEAGQLDYWDATLGTFGLRISQGGSKTFIIKVGNSRRTIGRYPILSLSEARTEAKRMLAEKTLGKLRPQSLTYAKAKELFLDDKRNARRGSTADGYEYYLDRFFEFSGMVGDVQHGELVRRLDRIKAPSTYNHALAAARAFFNWCAKRRYLTENPITGISERRKVSRDRVLEDDELKAVWEACGKSDTDMPESFPKIVRLLILTGQRRSEVAGLRGEFFADQSCTLPKELCKNGRAHTFPVGTMAADIVGNAAPGLLFPARGRETPFNGWSKAKAALDKASGVDGWTLHDLRRTFATNLAKLGVPIHVVEKLLNHISGTTGGLVGIYQKHAYWDEQVDAVRRWEDRLRAIVAPMEAATAA